MAGILVMGVASVAELCGLAGHEHMVTFVSQNTGLFAGVFLFVAYLLGVLVRLFAPEYVDGLSTLYLAYFLQDKREWVTDEFPYEKTLTSRLRESGMGKIAAMMSKLNSTYGEARNKEFFNYCKWFIDANDPALSRQVQDAEALVRFLSGTTFALLIAVPLALSLLITFAVYGAAVNSALYGVLLTIDIICLAMILRRFKHQRRREVLMVWSCVHLIVNGGTPSELAHDRDRLCESVFFPASLEQSDSAGVVEESPHIDPRAAMGDPDDVTTYLTVVREMIRHEDDLVNQRLGWMFALQGLLFTAAGFLWTTSEWPVVTIGCVGLLSCVSVGYSLGRALSAMSELHKKASERKTSLLDVVRDKLPPTVGARNRAVGWLLPAILLPWVIGAAWVAMIILRVCKLC